MTKPNIVTIRPHHHDCVIRQLWIDDKSMIVDPHLPFDDFLAQCRLISPLDDPADVSEVQRMWTIIHTSQLTPHCCPYHDHVAGMLTHEHPHWKEQAEAESVRKELIAAGVPEDKIYANRHYRPAPHVKVHVHRDHVDKAQRHIERGGHKNVEIVNEAGIG